MHLQGHKRKCNDDNSYSNYIPKLTGLPPNLAKIASSSGVVDYSDDFALTDLRGISDESKYGSVTEEYEDLRAQRMQFMSIVSAFRQQNVAFRTHGSTNTQSDLSTIQNQKNPIRRDDILSDDVIDLETDTMTGATSHVKVLPEQTVEADNNISSCSNDFACGPLNSSPASEDKKQETVIIIDSDEEDASHSIENKYGTSSDLGASERRLLLTSQIQKHISRATKLAQEVNSLQLVSPYKAIGRTNAMATTLNWQPSVQFEKVVLQKADEKQRFQDVVNENSIEIRSQILSADTHNSARKRPDINGNVRSQRRDAEAHNNVLSVVPYSELNENDASVQENTFLRSFNEDDKVLPQSDGLEELWKDMALAIECSKGGASDGQEDVQQEDDCNHSYMLQDDFGLVCRICGVIQKSIDTIFDYQWTKVSRSTRTYVHESRNCKDLDEAIRFSGVKGSEDELIAAEVSIHPRHLKQMKPHQLEGFNFLVKNLVTDKPGGCILAHAPGSGKTFMLISFIQSFLAKYPSKRPLVVLPKGILPIWKKEFKRWQVEDLPIYDFYSVKADNRSQQVDVLKLWQENKSILFLGYKQFSNIISDKENSKVSAACREMLLKIPGLLILDEGHTPRNEDTYTLDSLAKVQTPRKVVLSGTLFQNNVREVFNILNLVRPKFLKMEHSRFIVKRVLSKVQISAGKKLSKLENAFYDLVEDTLQNDENFNRKVTVIRDLRELTNDVLHYYKGDFLEELPGLVDFTILLNLSSKQKLTVQCLDKFEKFKRTSVGSAVYVHPSLFDTAEKSTGDKHSVSKDDNAKIDSLLEFINFRDGVKTKFFLNILSLAESVGEKLLAFSQYLLPLRFLERLLVKTKGWQTNKEIFMITGDSQVEERERSMEQFNNSLDAKVFFGSIKACGEGISLVGASRVVILDVHLNPSVTRQAIGRAFRPGQLKKVYTYRLVAADSPEAEDHRTSYRKELISKMWFEWSDYCGLQDFQLDEVDLANCEDLFLESRHIGEDIKAVYRR